MTDIYAFLEGHGIPYERVDHPPVSTVEEAERLVPAMPGAHTKNLFLRDEKGRRHFLIVVGHEGPPRWVCCVPSSSGVSPRI